MSANMWRIIFMAIIAALLIWHLSSSSKTEKFTQSAESVMVKPIHIQVEAQVKTKVDLETDLETIIKLVIDHIFYERMLMIAFFTNKEELGDVQDKLIENSAKISEYIRKHRPELLGLSDQIDKHLDNLDPLFNLIYEVYESIESGNRIRKVSALRNLTIVAMEEAEYLDNILGTDIFQEHVSEYLKWYIKGIYAYLSENRLADNEYMRKTINAGIEIIVELFR